MGRMQREKKQNGRKKDEQCEGEGGTGELH